VVIEVYGLAMASFPEVPFMETMPATMGRINGAVFAAAFLAGLIGLFQVISAREADSRLQLAGFRRWELFCTRLATIASVSLVAAVAAFAVLAWRVDVAAPLAAFGALALAGLLYGLLGVLIGAVVPRELEGSLLLVFVADFDDFMASGLANVDSPLLHLLPLHYPHKLFTAAVRDGTVASADVLAALGYLAVAFVAVLLAYVTLTDGTAAAATPPNGGVPG
jgi:ABC-2 type transport system permease protein